MVDLLCFSFSGARYCLILMIFSFLRLMNLYIMIEIIDYLYLFGVISILARIFYAVVDCL